MKRIAVTALVLIFASSLSAQWDAESIKVRNRFRESEIRQKLSRAYLFESAAGEQDDFDAGYYELDLTIAFGPDELTGKVTGTYASRTNDLTRIVLDFDDNMVIDSVYGNVYGWSHSNYELQIALDRTYGTGERFTVTVVYHGLPRRSGDNYFVFTNSIDGPRTVWSLSEPYGARTWWPCKDTPADKADSADIRITVPVRYKAVSNGKLISITDNPDQTRTWHWHESFPITTYLVSIAVADYAHFADGYINSTGDSLLLDYYVYPSQLATARNLFSEVPQYMEALEHFFGPYPFPGEKYGMAQFTWGGGMEHQTITSIGGVRSSWRYIYVHELAHQWYGDQVTCASWQDIWLNEGFASYAEALYVEYFNGEQAYHGYMATQEYTAGGTVFIEDTSRVGNIFGRIVYDKGSWVLHMLRHVLGDSVFFEALRSWAQQSPASYASATTEDFKNHCESVSGRQLDVFFDQWIYRPGFPEYQYSWKWNDRIGGAELQITIEQTQQQGVYEMPVDISVFGENTDTTFTVQNTQARQTYFINVPFEPLKVVLDKDNWILKTATDISSGRANPNSFVLYQNYPNPFNAGTTFRWFAPFRGTALLQIFNINGELVYSKDIFNSAGQVVVFRWDGRDDRGRETASGIYLYRAVFRGFWGEESTSGVRKLIRIK